MLAGVRANAGLGDSTTPFYTNVPESANAVIKRAVNFQESEMSNFTLKMAQLIRHQKEDIRGTLLNSGPYKLTHDYTNLQLLQEKWFSMTPEQREAYENAFDKKCLNEEDMGHDTERNHEMPSLSVSAEEAHLTCHPLQTVERVFRKAQSVLSKENAIVPAPGSNGIGLHGGKPNFQTFNIQKRMGK